MRTYQIVGLLVVVGGLGFIAGVRVGATRATTAASPTAGGGPCCGPLPARATHATPAPQIPTASGRPCLVEFGANECEACRRMGPVLAEARKRLQGQADVLQVDTDAHPAQAQKWRLRLIPTQILVAPSGRELWRHEGYIAPADLQAALQPHLHGPPQASGG